MRFEHISVNPKICHGAPAFKGTRIPLHLILDLLSAGETVENIIKNYPRLTRKHILEALTYASASLKYEERVLEIAR